MRAKLYLPDAQQGYYRATRFDWSGQIASLESQGHNYFGQWFEKYDPNSTIPSLGRWRSSSPTASGWDTTT